MKIYAPQISGSLAINGTSIGNFNNLVSTSSFNQYTSSTSTGSLATTGSNTFVGKQTMSGSIIPAVTNIYDLGDVTHQFRHLYLSSGSLYINGTKVLGASGQELQITTDNGQSLKILEAGSDTITLQSADGNITLATSGGGDVILDPTSGIIALKGTTTLYAGNKILSSDGGAIQVGNDLGITGSLVTTGNINGINLTTFSSSIASTLLNQNTATSSYETKGSGIVSGSSQITPLLPTGTISGSSQILGGSGLVSGSSQITYTSISSIPSGIVSGAAQVTTLLPTGVISGSSQLNNASIENLTVINLTTVNETARVIFSSGSNRFGDFGNDIHDFTGSVKISGSFTLVGSSTATSYNGTINATNGVVSGSSQITYANISSIPGGIVSGSSQTIANLPTGTVSGSSQIVSILSSINTYTGSNDTTNTAQSARLTTIESVTGSYETKGIGIVSGSSQITYTGISSIPVGIVSGSSQITYTNISSIPAGIVSGSSQITYANISSIPGGIVSGSAQTIFNLPTGTISGSSQVNVMSTTNIARLATTGSNAFTGNQTITGTINTISIPNDLFAFQFLLMGG